MGSIGKSERQEQAYRAQLRQNNSAEIIQFPNDEYDEEVANDQAVKGSSAPGGWDYPGIRDSIDKIEAKASRARSANTYADLIKALKSIDRTITTSMNTGDERDDKNALLTYRRRVRTLTRQLKQKYQNKL